MNLLSIVLQLAVLTMVVLLGHLAGFRLWLVLTLPVVMAIMVSVSVVIDRKDVIKALQDFDQDLGRIEGGK